MTRRELSATTDASHTGHSSWTVLSKSWKSSRHRRRARQGEKPHPWRARWILCSSPCMKSRAELRPAPLLKTPLHYCHRRWTRRRRRSTRNKRRFTTRLRDSARLWTRSVFVAFNCTVRSHAYPLHRNSRSPCPLTILSLHPIPPRKRSIEQSPCTSYVLANSPQQRLLSEYVNYTPLLICSPTSIPRSPTSKSLLNCVASSWSFTASSQRSEDRMSALRSSEHFMSKVTVSLPS